MNKVLLKEAITNNAWYECRGTDDDDEVVQYKIRVIGFGRTTLEEINESLVNNERVEGILWLLSIEVVCLCKQPMDKEIISKTLILIDEDNYQFEAFRFKSMEFLRLDQNTDCGLTRFARFAGAPPLSPKIKVSGALAFALPDEENNYYLSVRDGQIIEA